MRDETGTLFFIPHPLINFRKHFAADVFATRGLTAHQAARGRDDIDAVAAEHPWNLSGAHVDATPGPRHSCQMRDRRGAARIVAQEDAYVALDALALDDE